MWQIGVLTAERSVFWARKWPFSAVSHYVLNEKPGNAYFCSAKMLQIATVSHYVLSYLANWHSDCRTAQFLCQTRWHSDILHYVFSINAGNAKFFSAKWLLPQKKGAGFGHFTLPLGEENVANWRSGCPMAHFVPKKCASRTLRTTFSVGKREIPIFFKHQNTPSRERVRWVSAISHWEKPGSAFR